MIDGFERIAFLAVIPPCGFPDEHQRIVAQYRAQFDQRLTGTLRDVEIGFVKGDGFAGMTKQDEWVRTADAVAMLKPILSEYAARIRICERAHGGLIRARAEQFHGGKRIEHDHDIPKEFWWAEGHQALEQDWTTGDFSTWIDRGSVQLKAFGVTFARADIQKLLPAASSVKTETVVHSDEDAQIIEKLEALVPSAALSYKQAVLDLKDESRVSFRGPALELREALREILDYLAPDSDVTAAPGYIQEKDRSGPMMKQKVRFIMREKGKRSSSDVPENAVTAFEEAIAGLTRAVYRLSSKATHVAGERQTVVQLRRYVVAIFHEIMEP
jgi:Predicted pPIWI-associating nuclease